MAGSGFDLGRLGRGLLGLFLAFWLVGCALAPGFTDPSGKSVTNVGTGQQVPVIPMREAMQDQPRGSDTPTAELPNTQPGAYRVGPRDRLAIVVWNYSTLGLTGDEAKPQVFEVGADGNFYYPYAGTIHAQGKTVEQLRREITRLLVRYVKSPQVSVTVAAYLSRKVYVLGQVTNPGVLPLTGYPLTVLEAIAQSGGLTETASTTRAYLTRKGKRYEIRMDLMLENGIVSQNYLLKDGDILQIPDNSGEKVFVMGAVRRPDSVMITGGHLSLSDALAEAGGVDEFAANARHIYVIRGDFSAPKIYHLDLREADALLLGDQFMLQPRDVVYVSDAGIARWNKVLSLLLPNLQTMFYLDSMRR